MQLVDRIEKRRFVGREFLLWLWFESEIFDATLSTREHGPFGLWLEKRLVLSEGKESTRITSPMPGTGREAKEALLRGQLPESAGVRIAWHNDETAFVLKAETLAVSGLKLQTLLGADKDEPNALLEEMKGPQKPKPKREALDTHEVFYERMMLTAEFEQLLETLYRDFLRLRLSESWSELVAPLLRGWILGIEIDTSEYEALRRAPAMVSDVLELKTGLRAVPPSEPEEVLEVSEADVEEVPLATLDDVPADELADVLDEPQVAVGE